MNTSARYVAITMDGSLHWAEWGHLPATEGLRVGWETLKERLRDAVDLGIEELTILETGSPLGPGLVGRIASEISELKDRGVRVCFIGRRSGLSAGLIERIILTEAKTAANDRITLFITLKYDGRDEITNAAQGFGSGGEADFRTHLYAPKMHDPDLLIRTFGERRLSGCPLWQCAYSELIFRDEPWPEFDRIALEECLGEFDARQRRYGARL